MNHTRGKEALRQICIRGTLQRTLEHYIRTCRAHVEESEGDTKKRTKRPTGRFPNLAGFCRRCGFEGNATERLRRDYPESYAELCLIFEDEALNSKVSASVLSAYLKRRLGYDGNEVEPPPCELGQLKLIFEHDVLTDGE